MWSGKSVRPLSGAKRLCRSTRAAAYTIYSVARAARAMADAEPGTGSATQASAPPPKACYEYWSRMHEGSGLDHTSSFAPCFACASSSTAFTTSSDSNSPAAASRARSRKQRVSSFRLPSSTSRAK